MVVLERFARQAHASQGEHVGSATGGTGSGAVQEADGCFEVPLSQQCLV